jgi:delta8-fatty-acid desaturase
MAVYRIGRIEGKWVNFTPPIRGGIFKKHEKEVKVEARVVEDMEKGDYESSGGWKRLDVGARAVVEEVNSSDDESDVDVDKNEGPILPTIDATHPPTSAFTPPPNRDARILDAMQLEIDQARRDYPPIDDITQNAITAKYELLHQRVHSEGFYHCRYTAYLKESLRYALLFTLFIVTLRAQWYLTSACFLGFFWQQIMFTAHDAGHCGITSSFIPDTLIGIFIADFCCGLSIGWWKSSHNVHHLVTNSPEHDPDIQNTPLFATCPSQFSDTTSTYYNGFVFRWDAVCEKLLPFQKYAYYPIMAVARFNLYMLGWCHLLSPRSKPLGAAAWTRPVEIIGMITFWYTFGYRLVLLTLPDWPTRIAFVLLSHAITMVLHVQITLSHWGMPTCDLGDSESFPQKQLRTTLDVACPEWLDWFHGGLQFQAIHHLFPRVPRHNLRRLQPLVVEFCKETGIKYNLLGFLDGNKSVIGRLEDISRQLEILGKCQAHMAETGESGLHWGASETLLVGGVLTSLPHLAGSEDVDLGQEIVYIWGFLDDFTVHGKQNISELWNELHELN